MHLRRILLLVSAAALAASIAPAATASPRASASHPATTSVTVTPVTSAGRAAAGFTVKTRPGDGVDCSSPDPSPGSVSPNVEECGPSAAYAIACWKSATPHHVLCMQNPRSHTVYSLKRSGKFAKTPAVSAAERSPLLLVLTDGTKCSIRDGGAWGTLQSHPQWYGTYSCTKHGVVWSKPSANHYGVNESSASWTVHTAAASGVGKLTVRHVAKAYFVATELLMVPLKP